MTTHTDHPLRHWDRTCPACIEGANLIDAFNGDAPFPDIIAKAAPTVPDISGDCVGTGCKAEGLMKQLAAAEARVKELEAELLDESDVRGIPHTAWMEDKP